MSDDPVTRFTLRPDYTGVLDSRGRPAGHLVALRCPACHRILSGAVARRGDALYCGGCA